MACFGLQVVLPRLPAFIVNHVYMTRDIYLAGPFTHTQNYMTTFQMMISMQCKQEKPAGTICIYIYMIYHRPAPLCVQITIAENTANI